MKRFQFLGCALTLFIASGCIQSPTDLSVELNVKNYGVFAGVHAGGKTDVFAINTAANTVYKWGEWYTMGGLGVSISGRSIADLWHINKSGQVFELIGGAVWNERPLPNGEKGLDIGAAGGTNVFVTTTTFHIYKWNGSSWISYPGLAARIDVDHNGNVWMAKNDGQVYQWVNGAWESRAGITAQDIGVGNGVVYAAGMNQYLYKWSGSSWQVQTGGGTRIDVDDRGYPWLLNSAGKVYQFYSGRGWVERFGITGKDIAACQSGFAAATGTNQYIYRYSYWTDRYGQVKAISGLTAQDLWRINVDGQVYQLVSGFWILRTLPAGKIGLDIGAAGGNNVYVTTTTYNIYKWDGSAWVVHPGLAARIDADQNGNLWMAKNDGQVCQWVNGAWESRAGITAQDIGVGNGVVYAVGMNQYLYKWSGSAWETIQGLGIRIDVDPYGYPWHVNSSGQVFELSPNIGWVFRTGVTAKDLAAVAD